MGLPLAVLARYVELRPTYDFEERIGNSPVFAEPVGVVGAITPWNYPLHQIVAKVAPGAGGRLHGGAQARRGHPARRVRSSPRPCTRPACPPGVFNLVTGTGPVAGQALAAHPGVDLVSFTGSTAVGERIGAAVRAADQAGRAGARRQVRQRHPAGRRPRRAGREGRRQRFMNSGQTCSAWTRMLVPADRYDEAVELAAAAAAKYPATRRPTRLGPLVNAKQRDRVRGYIETGRRARAPGRRRRPRAADGLEQGYYVRADGARRRAPGRRPSPRRRSSARCWSILPYEDEDDALRHRQRHPVRPGRRACGPDEETAVAFARRMDTGQVDINGGRFNPLAPFGGYKQSGVGREFGTHGLAEYLQYKSLQF